MSEETNVNDVVAKVALGQADAGIVYKSDVPAAYQSKVQVIDDPSQCERPCQIPNRGSQQFVERSTGAEFHKLRYLSCGSGNSAELRFHHSTDFAEHNHRYCHLSHDIAEYDCCAAT